MKHDTLVWLTSLALLSGCSDGTGAPSAGGADTGPSGQGSPDATTDGSTPEDSDLPDGDGQAVSDAAPPTDSAPDSHTADGSADGDGATDSDATMDSCPGNLIVNGTFDHNVDHWVVFPGPTVHSVVHDAKDADDSPSSGSLRSRTTRDINQRSVVRQCVAIAGDTTVTARAEAWMVGESDVFGEVQLGMTFYSQPHCGGSFISGSTEFAPLQSVEDEWLDFVVTATSPTGAQSLNVFLDAYRRTGSSLTTYWDNVCLTVAD
jgi:hypothetical protein